MKTARLTACLFGGLIACTYVGIAHTQQAKPEPSTESQLTGLMLAKLATTQRVVSGLVSRDYGEIKRGASELIRVCDANQWETNPDPLYTHYRHELRRQAVKLTEQADRQNLDGAAYAYLQSISTCIHCHEHCRDVLRIAQTPSTYRGVISIPTSDNDERWNGMPTLRR